MKIVVSLLLMASVAMADISLFDPVPIKDSDYAPFDGRITNGNEARLGQFPYQAALQLTATNGGGFFCGGTLISNRWILTAAHCTDGVKSVTVTLGAINRAGNDAGQMKIVVPQSNIIIHSKYNANLISNDISLIKLPNPIAFTNNIQPAKLPANNYNTYAGQQAVASGWGKISDSATSVTNVLRFVSLPIITNDKCKLTFAYYINPTNICADGANGKSICNGDSGGPLGIANTVVGVSSFVSGSGCAVGAPSAFTRVSEFLDWIKSYTGPL